MTATHTEQAKDGDYSGFDESQITSAIDHLSRKYGPIKARQMAIEIINERTAQ